MQNRNIALIVIAACFTVLALTQQDEKLFADIGVLSQTTETTITYDKGRHFSAILSEPRTINFAARTVKVFSGHSPATFTGLSHNKLSVNKNHAIELSLTQYICSIYLLSPYYDDLEELRRLNI
ncbi:MAG: hypothetical protein LBV39_06305 [Bacteroidales bacterium]|jgi:hypothetical protein|nr:hypothetical protein [Bacteroidales bacterium]